MMPTTDMVFYSQSKPVRIKVRGKYVDESLSYIKKAMKQAMGRVLACPH
jgi:hypothetical protein